MYICIKENNNLTTEDTKTKCFISINFVYKTKNNKLKGEKVYTMTVKKEMDWNLDNSYARLPKVFFSEVNPTPVDFPKLVIFNHPLANSLGLDVEKLQRKESVEIFAGNEIPQASIPLAQAYAGHQFGHFTMLGDGRALLLGEQLAPEGERFDVQLKGAGRTPYSRGGDGRAALGPMLREYIISEGMHALGIPTTRSLAVVTTGEKIIRETELEGGILTRIASSHIRVGTFQYISKWGTKEELKMLADYTLNRHFSQADDNENPYILLLRKVVEGQARLIAKWQLVGFVHGVMNTDNMTISGETIDYGPCAFMDTYDPDTVFSSIDRRGRYAYGNQPSIGGWNLARFAEALLPILNNDQEEAIKLAQDTISEFNDIYRNNWLDGMRAKLGISNKEPGDESLIEDLLTMMKNHNADYTNTFRVLTLNNICDTSIFGTTEFTQWNKLWQSRLSRQKESRDCSYELMRNSNPAIIPRNHRVEEALEAAVEQGNYKVMEKLLDVLSKPYEYSKDQDYYSIPPPPSAQPYRTFCGT